MTNEKQMLTLSLLHFSIVRLIAGVMLFFQMHQWTACTNKKQQVWKTTLFFVSQVFQKLPVTVKLPLHNVHA